MKPHDSPPSPVPSISPEDGYRRPGLVYVDDSATSLQAMRRALYPHRILLETFLSGAALAAREPGPLRGALLDLDLGEGESGLDLARALRARDPSLPIAFLTASNDAARAQLVRYGQVFSKETDRPAVVAWLLSLVPPADEG